MRPRKLYHVTSESNVESIRGEGLVPGSTKGFEGTFPPYEHNYVWFYDSLSHAKSAGRVAFGGDFAVVVIDASRLNSNALSNVKYAPGFVVYKDIVPPEAFLEVRQYSR